MVVGVQKNLVISDDGDSFMPDDGEILWWAHSVLNDATEESEIEAIENVYTKFSNFLTRRNKRKTANKTSPTQRYLNKVGQRLISFMEILPSNVPVNRAARKSRSSG